MIDSICLSIPWSEIQNIADDWDLQSRTERYSRYIKNPSKSDLKTGYYFPRLTSYGKWFKQNANVRIEFSVSKLLFLNNLDELEDADFPKAVSTLQERLKTMGLIVSEESIKNAVVSSVHFSKNIHLEDGYTTNYLISEINKVNLRKVLILPAHAIPMTAKACMRIPHLTSSLSMTRSQTYSPARKELLIETRPITREASFQVLRGCQK
ncbi:MAG: hypothetical protein V4467_00845 [Patescibacteria group bacterium]